MNRLEKAKVIVQILDELFPYPEIPLHYKNPYTLLIAVLLSAQCTDARVNQVTPHLFQLADTPEKMGRLTPKKIEEVIRSCGLAPTKSKAIWKLSQELVANFGGQVPSSEKLLEKLPGVGHKTASVVRGSAFHIPTFPVDTHIFRLAHRWGLSQGKTAIRVEQDLKKLFPETLWMKRHLQMILYARKFCPARGHKKTNCPICHRLAVQG